MTEWLKVHAWTICGLWQIAAQANLAAEWTG
jgi:hypothetical protein